MTLPKNGVAKEIRSYAGSLFVFLFIVGIIITFVQFPVLESNKEIVLMLIGSIAASIPVLISAISGTRPDDINALKSTLVMFLTALMMALTVYGIFTDKDKDGIPDALEDKFNQVVSDIKQEIEKIKK